MPLPRSAGKRLTISDRSNILLNKIENEIIIGLLLVDRHIAQRSVKGNCRFVFGKSAIRMQHLSYFYHVYGLFKQFCAPDFMPKFKIWTDKRSSTKY